MKTGVRHTMKLANYSSSSTVVQTDNGYKSEQEQAVTLGIYKTSNYIPERCHQNYFLQKHTALYLQANLKATTGYHEIEIATLGP